MWAAQYWKCDEPRTFITSGGLGTMGFGLPAAIGAQCAMPDRLVINLNGDGSFQQTMQALITASEERLPIKIVLLDNENLGMVRQWQELFYEKRFFSVALANPDFVKLAEAMGAKAFSASAARRAGRGLREGASPSRTAPPSSTSRSTRPRTATRCGRPGSRSTR